MCFWPTAGTFPPTESFLPVEIMWVPADGKRTWSSITSQEWKRQFFVTLFHGCQNTVHGSYRTSHYSDSALLCVTPRFDCGIHHHILDLWRVKNKLLSGAFVVAKLSNLKRCNSKLVDLSTFHLCTDMIIWKGDLGSMLEVDISHLPVSRDVTLSENGWSSEVNPEFEKRSGTLKKHLQ